MAKLWDATRYRKDLKSHPHQVTYINRLDYFLNLSL